MTRFAFVLAAVVIGMALTFSPACLAQAGIGRGVPDLGPIGQRPQNPPNPMVVEMEKRQERELNRKRYADLKRETDRLLQLATELKVQVDKAGEHTLSLEVIRKTDEIEKLARSVRARMKAQ